LRSSVSAIVQNFSIGFGPGGTGEAFDRDMMDTLMIKLPPLPLRFVPKI
jgi:hypothetical protein